MSQTIHDDKPIFDALRVLLGGKLRQSDVDIMKHAILLACEDGPSDLTTNVPPSGRDVSAAGLEAIKSEEGLARLRSDGRVQSYPDPGSRDGKPWTIGYGSTGPDIGPDTIWTKAQCEARFAADIRLFEHHVDQVLGDAATTQDQFDALVSFAYNVGLDSFRKSTLLAKHRAGDYSGAAAEFARWKYNDGKVMDGLVERRAREATRYAGGTP